MRLIKEPKGVDFIIESDPLTNKERKEISEFIKNSKENKKDLKHRRIAKTKKMDLLLLKKNVKNEN